MSSIFTRLTRVSLVNSFTTRRRSFHYQHGIPGIPTDGKVVLLKNSGNGAQVHLVGTVHRTKETTQTVKKVINYVRPDTIAIELCESRAVIILEHPSEDDNLYTLYLQSKRAQGGLSTKVGMFIRNCLHLLREEVVPSNCEFKVAMQEASRLGAACYFIDQDNNVIEQRLVNLFISSDSFWQSFERLIFEACNEMNEDDFSRSSIQELNSLQKDLSPETFRILVEDRDKHMFKKLRRFQGEVVAVVGMSHMDGIELLWKRAENGDGWQPPASQKCGLAMYAGLNRLWEGLSVSR